MLDAFTKCDKDWKIIDDSSKTKDLQQNSVLVLHILRSDLYEHFYRQRGDRFDVWSRMEKYIRTKYNKLSDKALSRIITSYHIDDR